MTEKTEWEVVDAPEHDSPRQHLHRAGLAHALLGPKWKLKAFGIGVVAVVLFAGVATVAILLAAVLAAAGAVAVGVLQLRRLLHRSAGPRFPAARGDGRNDPLHHR